MHFFFFCENCVGFDIFDFLLIRTVESKKYRTFNFCIGPGLDITTRADLKSRTYCSGSQKKFCYGPMSLQLVHRLQKSFIYYISSRQTNRNFHQYTDTATRQFSEASLSSICTAIQRLSFHSIVSTHLSLRVISYGLCQRICLAVSISALQQPQTPYRSTVPC